MPLVGMLTILKRMLHDLPNFEVGTLLSQLQDNLLDEKPMVQRSED